MDKKKVKTYFSKEDTVYNWWNPNDSDKKEVYLRQERIISKIVKKRGFKKIIDISSGKGRYALLLSKGKDYTCLDISKQMLNHIKKLNLKVRLINADAEKIPLKEKFDLVLCSESLVHYPYPEKAIKGMKRIIKKGGTIIITVDNKYCLGKIVRILENFIKSLLKKEGKSIGNKIYQPYSNKEYRKMFKKQNLRIIKTISFSIFTTPIKVGKNDSYILSPKISRKLLFLDYILEKVPLINKLSTYFIYILEYDE